MRIPQRGVDHRNIAAPDGTLYEGSLYVRGRYPVGSGDAFLAGLVTGLDRGEWWDVALRLALGAATANAELPAILITADRSPRVREEARSCGIHVLYKPVKPAALRALLAQCQVQQVAAAE